MWVVLEFEIGFGASDFNEGLGHETWLEHGLGMHDKVLGGDGVVKLSRLGWSWSR